MPWILGLVAQHRIVDVFGDLLEGLGLVVVRVDVDDQEVLVLALDRLLGGVAQQRAGVELLARQIAEVPIGLVLQVLSDRSACAPSYRCCLCGVRRPMPDIDCQAPNSNTSRPAPSSSAVQPIATSVDGDAAVAAERPRRLAHLRLRRIEPDDGAEHLAERVVGNVVQAGWLDRFGAGRGEIARQLRERRDAAQTET